jgi:epoxyqueuosine reductase
VLRRGDGGNIHLEDRLHDLFSNADYDKDGWFARTEGMEWEPERGARCTMCFDMRFERTARFG